MINFCKSCSSKDVPNFIKEKYNSYVKPTFTECPIYDEKIAGCILRYKDFKWKFFIEWLKDNSLLNNSELKILEKKDILTNKEENENV